MGVTRNTNGEVEINAMNSVPNWHSRTYPTTTMTPTRRALCHPINHTHSLLYSVGSLSLGRSTKHKHMFTMCQLLLTYDSYMYDMPWHPIGIAISTSLDQLAITRTGTTQVYVHVNVALKEAQINRKDRKMPSQGSRDLCLSSLPVLPLGKASQKARTSSRGQPERLMHLTAVRAALLLSTHK